MILAEFGYSKKFSALAAFSFSYHIPSKGSYNKGILLPYKIRYYFYFILFKKGSVLICS